MSDDDAYLTSQNRVSRQLDRFKGLLDSIQQDIAAEEDVDYWRARMGLTKAETPEEKIIEEENEDEDRDEWVPIPKSESIEEVDNARVEPEDDDRERAPSPEALECPQSSEGVLETPLAKHLRRSASASSKAPEEQDEKSVSSKLSIASRVSKALSISSRLSSSLKKAKAQEAKSAQLERLSSKEGASLTNNGAALDNGASEGNVIKVVEGDLPTPSAEVPEERDIPLSEVGGDTDSVAPKKKKTLLKSLLKALKSKATKEQNNVTPPQEKNVTPPQALEARECVASKQEIDADKLKQHGEETTMLKAVDPQDVDEREGAEINEGQDGDTESFVLPEFGSQTQGSGANEAEESMGDKIATEHLKSEASSPFPALPVSRDPQECEKKEPENEQLANGLKREGSLPLPSMSASQDAEAIQTMENEGDKVTKEWKTADLLSRLAFMSSSQSKDDVTKNVTQLSTLNAPQDAAAPPETEGNIESINELKLEYSVQETDPHDVLGLKGETPDSGATMNQATEDVALKTEMASHDFEAITEAEPEEDKNKNEQATDSQEIDCGQLTERVESTDREVTGNIHESSTNVSDAIRSRPSYDIADESHRPQGVTADSTLTAVDDSTKPELPFTADIATEVPEIARAGTQPTAHSDAISSDTFAKNRKAVSKYKIGAAEIEARESRRKVALQKQPRPENTSIDDLLERLDGWSQDEDSVGQQKKSTHPTTLQNLTPAAESPSPVSELAKPGFLDAPSSEIVNNMAVFVGLEAVDDSRRVVEEKYAKLEQLIDSRRSSSTSFFANLAKAWHSGQTEPVGATKQAESPPEERSELANTIENIEAPAESTETPAESKEAPAESTEAPAKVQISENDLPAHAQEGVISTLGKSVEEQDTARTENPEKCFAESVTVTASTEVSANFPLRLSQPEQMNNQEDTANSDLKDAEPVLAVSEVIESKVQAQGVDNQDEVCVEFNDSEKIAEESSPTTLAVVGNEEAVLAANIDANPHEATIDSTSHADMKELAKIAEKTEIPVELQETDATNDQEASKVVKADSAAVIPPETKVKKTVSASKPAPSEKTKKKEKKEKERLEKKKRREEKKKENRAKRVKKLEKKLANILRTRNKSKQKPATHESPVIVPETIPEDTVPPVPEKVASEDYKITVGAFSPDPEVLELFTDEELALIGKQWNSGDIETDQAPKNMVEKSTPKTEKQLVDELTTGDVFEGIDFEGLEVEAAPTEPSKSQQEKKSKNKPKKRSMKKMLSWSEDVKDNQQEKDSAHGAYHDIRAQARDDVASAQAKENASARDGQRTTVESSSDDVQAVIWWSNSRDAVEVMVEIEDDDGGEEKSLESDAYSSLGGDTFGSLPSNGSEYTDRSNEPEIGFSFSSIKQVTSAIVEEVAYIHEEVSVVGREYATDVKEMVRGLFGGKKSKSIDKPMKSSKKKKTPKKKKNKIRRLYEA